MNRSMTKNKFLIFISFLTILLVGGCADYKEARNAKKDGNYETALAHFKELADFGHAPSQVELARMYLRGQGGVEQPVRAFGLLQKAAASNNEKAYFELGRLYEKGSGVSQNAGLAAENYSKAMDGGYYRASFYWGRMLENGKITAQNIPKAMSLYHYSARRGYARSAFYLAELMEQNGILSEMFDIYKEEGAGGTKEARDVMRLALYYAAGHDIKIEVGQAIAVMEYLLSQEQQKHALSIAKIYYTGGS